MSIRVRPPETKRLKISNDDWLEVKKHLTAGESRAMYARMFKYNEDGSRHVDTARVGISKVTAYLLDWSFQDADGKVMPIAGQPPDVVESYLDAIDPDSFKEVKEAIETHEAEMDGQLKKTPDGEKESSATLPSAAPSAGVIKTSKTSRNTSTASSLTN